MSLIGSQSDAGQSARGFVEPFKLDELVEFIGDNMFPIGAVAGVVQSNEQQLRFDPVERVDQIGQLEQRQRGRFGEQEQTSACLTISLGSPCRTTCTPLDAQ